MSDQTYLGLSIENSQLWVLVRCVNGKSVVLQRFVNSVTGYAALAQFIQSRFEKPRIYIASNGAQALNLLRYLVPIDDMEAVFVSAAGFAAYRAWIPQQNGTAARAQAPTAEVLARCAERLT